MDARERERGGEGGGDGLLGTVWKFLGWSEGCLEPSWGEPRDMLKGLGVSPGCLVRMSVHARQSRRCIKKNNFDNVCKSLGNSESLIRVAKTMSMQT